MLVVSSDFFIKVCDKMVELAEDDPEAKEDLRWLDEQGRKKGLSFYDVVFDMMYRNNIDARLRN